MHSIQDHARPRRIRYVNWTGLFTLVKKEVERFFNVYTQTLVAPVVTTLLFYAVFSLAFGGGERQYGDLPYMVFLAPGLLMMTMSQNAFANTSSSLVIAKVQGNIVDVLLPPISSGELLAGYLFGGLVRGLAVGFVSAVALSFFVHIGFHSVLAITGFAVLGTYMLSVMGIAAGLWSDKFDHMAAVTNFIVTPLTFLSGTFYSIEQLPETWQTMAHFNPFFYMIDGFRYGFIGQADGSILAGALTLLGVNAALTLLCLWMLRTGYKIKS